MESWPIVVLVLGLVGLVWCFWTNRTTARARSQAMSLQQDVWKVINQIRRQRELRPRDVTASWFAEYDAFFKEHGGIPSYSPDDENVDWQKCGEVLLEAYKRLQEFEARLRADLDAVRQARRENPANLQRLERLVAESKQLSQVDLRKVEHVEGLLALAKVSSTREDADSALMTAASLAAGLEEIRPLLPQAAAP